MADYLDPEEKKPTIATPAAGPRDPEAGPMPDSEFQSLVSGLISSAAQYVDGELSPARAKAEDYYHGRPFGNEEPGRSQFVSTDVRDGIQAIIPPMVRVLFSSERAVDFIPPQAEDVDGAEQATDYVHHIFAEDNPGFLNTLAMLKDGLLKKQGVWKWWWDNTPHVTQQKFENLTYEQIQLIAADDEIKITLIEQTGEFEGAPLFKVEATRTEQDGKPCYAVIPPEEFLYNREARSLTEAIAVWHRTRKTRGELIAMGIDAKKIDEHGGDDEASKDNEEAIARHAEAGSTEEVEAGKANDRHLYCEGYARIDRDGDGIAELRKVCTIGPAHYPVVNEPAEDDINFAVFCPDPEPHKLTGQSWADRLMDLQRYMSMLMRGMSDSLASSLFPRVVYKAGEVSLADVLNTQMGSPIRSTGDPNNTVREFAHTFLGREALPVIGLVNEINERRTGNNKGALGLDADALQSSAPGAVAAAVSASQAQQELLVRIFAESALKPLFKGIFKLLVKHQPRKRMVRLRNRWVEVDPRTWNSDMDVTVNVALGAGLLEEKIQTLLEISAKQAELLEKMPNNPIVGMAEYRATLAEITELRGKKDSKRYFKPFSAEDEKAMLEAQAQQPPPETPEMVLAKAQIEIERMKAESQDKREIQKVQRDLMIQQARLAMEWKKAQMEDERERQKALAEDDRERDKQASDEVIAMRELELKHQMNIQESEIKAEIELARATTQSGPGERSEAGDEGVPAAPARRRRRVTIARQDGRPPLQATIEDEDMGDDVVVEG